MYVSSSLKAIHVQVHLRWYSAYIAKVCVLMLCTRVCSYRSTMWWQFVCSYAVWKNPTASTLEPDRPKMETTLALTMKRVPLACPYGPNTFLTPPEPRVRKANCFTLPLGPLVALPTTAIICSPSARWTTWWVPSFRPCLVPMWSLLSVSLYVIWIPRITSPR